MPDAVGSKRIEEHGFARAHSERQQNRSIHKKATKYEDAAPAVSVPTKPRSVSLTNHPTARSVAEVKSKCGTSESGG
ncbi:MAG: hypothetical protein ABIZ83_16405 [Casimicrobium sp.]